VFRLVARERARNRKSSDLFAATPQFATNPPERNGTIPLVFRSTETPVGPTLASGGKWPRLASHEKDARLRASRATTWRLGAYFAANLPRSVLAKRDSFPLSAISRMIAL
jgi:hypothetical protein